MPPSGPVLILLVRSFSFGALPALRTAGVSRAARSGQIPDSRELRIRTSRRRTSSMKLTELSFSKFLMSAITPTNPFPAQRDPLFGAEVVSTVGAPPSAETRWRPDAPLGANTM